MAHLDMKTEYHLQLKPDEFRLIGLALAGKLAGKDVEAARLLNVALQTARLSQVDARQRVCSQTLEMAKELSAVEFDAAKAALAAAKGE